MVSQADSAAMLSLGVIDGSQFPVAYIHGANLLPGDGLRIIEDMETLIRHAKVFVLVIVNGDVSTHRHHDEDKARMLWLKQNKSRLAKVCQGIHAVPLYRALQIQLCRHRLPGHDRPALRG